MITIEKKPGGRAVDITGGKFGMLTALRDVGSRNNRRRWLFQCDCGACVERDAITVRNIARKGGKPNCGCALSEIRAGNGRLGRTHGLSTHRLYDVHRQMLRRCENPNSKDYPLYGARGISVCDEWQDIHAFFDWALASGYEQGLTIERIDNDKGYSPDNCTWIPNERQAHNTRRLLLITHNGITDYASSWARRTGLPIRTIISRKRYGWDDARTIETPVRGQA